MADNPIAPDFNLVERESGQNTANALQLLYSQVQALRGQVNGPIQATDLAFNGDKSIRRTTVDGNDQGVITITGGGAVDQARGAFGRFYGNENSTPGSIQLVMGNVVNAVLDVYRSDGNRALTLDGATGLLTLQYGQIKLPATQNASTDANTLDDYEENTWTPADNSGAGLALTLGQCDIVKVGQMVVAQFDITYPATASGANSEISGLPYTCRNVMGFGGALTITSYTATPIAASINNNNTSFRFYNGITRLTNTNLSGKLLQGFLVYRATA